MRIITRIVCVLLLVVAGLAQGSSLFEIAIPNELLTRSGPGAGFASILLALLMVLMHRAPRRAWRIEDLPRNVVFESLGTSNATGQEALVRERRNGAVPFALHDTGEPDLPRFFVIVVEHGRRNVMEAPDGFPGGEAPPKLHRPTR